MTQSHNNCAETHLGGRDTSTFVVPLAAVARSLSSTWLPVQSYEGPTKILTTQPLSLSFSDAYMSKHTEFVSAVIRTCNTFFITNTLYAIATRAWSSRGMCINWNELQYLACSTGELQPVATQLPGNQECGCPSCRYKLCVTVMLGSQGMGLANYRNEAPEYAPGAKAWVNIPWILKSSSCDVHILHGYYIYMCNVSTISQTVSSATTTSCTMNQL